ncbi:SPOR domain-containing protein [Ferrovibrio xuzhouensis]|uniref:SPOR domain-containing protein n=1 Tax=Ferrovibrio xuzhouensis TaxID=1576914 RepID=A0ABV7VKP2_9PROT
MSDLRTERGGRPVPGDEQQGGSPKRMITAAIALGAVAAFGIGIWFAYDQGVKRGSSGAPPLIRADQGPTKVAPENPGGMQVPNQDKQIYDRIGGNVPPAGDDGKTERLLPPPERPSASVATAPATGPAGSAPSVTVPMRPAPSPVPNQAPNQAQGQQGQAATGIPNQTNAPSAMPLSQAEKTQAERTPAAKPAESKPAAKPAAEAPAKTASLASPGGSAKVQLASLKDQADAQATWNRLQKKFPELLNGLTPSYEKVEIPNKGAFVRLQVGPLKDRAAAQSLCQQLAAKNQGCIVVSK